MTVLARPSSSGGDESGGRVARIAVTERAQVSDLTRAGAAFFEMVQHVEHTRAPKLAVDESGEVPMDEALNPGHMASGSSAGWYAPGPIAI